MSKIKEIPIDDRPVERLILKGASSLSNEELLAILIKTGNKNESSKQLAYNLLKEYSSIYEFSKITLEELTKIKGIKDSKAAIILAAIELGKRINQKITSLKNLKMTEPSIFFDYYKSILNDKAQEHFFVVYLDINNRIIKDKLLFIGTLNYSLVHPREVFKEAYLNGAVRVVLVHNHPSGEVIPSKNDIDTTLNLKKVGKLLGIEVIDHIIIGDNKYYSLFENGDI